MAIFEIMPTLYRYHFETYTKKITKLPSIFSLTRNQQIKKHMDHTSPSGMKLTNWLIFFQNNIIFRQGR